MFYKKLILSISNFSESLIKKKLMFLILLTYKEITKNLLFMMFQEKH
jgi:hypothetical protein